MLLTVGLNHKTAPLAIREQLAFDRPQALSLLTELKRRFNGAEFVLLSTCNRVELYCATDMQGQPSAETLLTLISKSRQVAVPEFRQSVYVCVDEEAARHLMSVASGLDSMVVGETEILGQVKESFHGALAAGFTGPILNRLFNLAIATGKKIHSQTSISGIRSSVANLAVQLICRTLSDSAAKVLVIGAGEMGAELVRLLVDARYTDVTVVNRSGWRGLDVANRHGVRVVGWDSMGKRFGECDAVISSVASTTHIVSKADAETWLAGRSRDVLVVDIGVPRNIEPSVAEIAGVRLFSIDDLSPLLCEQEGITSEQMSRCYELLYQSAGDFMRWFASRDLGPLIGRMRQRFSQIAAQEISGFVDSSQSRNFSREDMELMAWRIVGKLSHCVIEQVEAVNRRWGTARAVNFLENVLEHAEEVYADPARMEEFVK